MSLRVCATCETWMTWRVCQTCVPFLPITSFLTSIIILFSYIHHLWSDISYGWWNQTSLFSQFFFTVFSLPAGDDQVLQRSQTGVIKVDVQGYPQPIFIWKKDSVNVGTQGRFSVKTDGSLEIKNVQESDQGNYTLDSSIADGMVEISKEMSVKVYGTYILSGNSIYV